MADINAMWRESYSLCTIDDSYILKNKGIHSIVHFANDSDSEAVMSFMRFKDGQIILMETGATPLSDDYQLVGQ